jgi:hypothetical protein
MERNEKVGGPLPMAIVIAFSEIANRYSKRGEEW